MYLYTFFEFPVDYHYLTSKTNHMDCLKLSFNFIINFIIRPLKRLSPSLLIDYDFDSDISYKCQMEITIFLSNQGLRALGYKIINSTT